jgi:hypothetical protein
VQADIRLFALSLKNRALLWGKLSAVAAMIKAVPVLEKGYEAIRAVLAAHGVALP